MSYYMIMAIGLMAQGLFSARLIIQWFKSEKEGRSLSPTIFWILSLIASIMLVLYGILRKDLAIILGQFISYFIYIRNLQYKGAWPALPTAIKWIVASFPLLAFALMALDTNHSWNAIAHNNAIPNNMLVWGTAGQVIFTLRFVYQWLYSEKIQESVIPLPFWVISLVGALLILTYAVYRMDLPIFMGQAFGVVIYSRNIFLSLKHKATSSSYD